jgi:5-methylcytosine-specific restriction endonuclease McrA
VRRVCVRRGPGCSDNGYAVPGRSRCRAHGGGAWARQPPSRQLAYASPLYVRNRRLAIEREPECHWRLPGCTGKSTTADHLRSVAQGGDHSLANLVGSCRPCNQRRGAAEGRAGRRPGSGADDRPPPVCWHGSAEPAQVRVETHSPEGPQYATRSILWRSGTLANQSTGREGEILISVL